MDADGHIGLFPPIIMGTGFQRFQDLGKFITEEDADNCGRGFAPAETMIVAGGSHRSTEQILIVINGFDHRGQEK